jgi:hypothetical protein
LQREFWLLVPISVDYPHKMDENLARRSPVQGGRNRFGRGPDSTRALSEDLGNRIGMGCHPHSDLLIEVQRRPIE